MLSLEERDEVANTIETVRRSLEELVVRGVRAAGSEHARRLEGLRDELARRDAHHMASRLGELGESLSRGDARAAGLLFRAQTSLRVFERVMTLDIASALLEQIALGAAEGEATKEETRPK